MRLKNPCIDCQHRYPACQSKCEIGIAYSKKRKEERELIKAVKSQERTFDQFKFERISETKKRCGLE